MSGAHPSRWAWQMAMQAEAGRGTRIEFQATLDAPLEFPSADLEAELRGLGGAVPPISPSVGIPLAPPCRGTCHQCAPVTAQKSSQKGTRAISDLAFWLCDCGRVI